MIFFKIISLGYAKLRPNDMCPVQILTSTQVPTRYPGFTDNTFVLYEMTGRKSNYAFTLKHRRLGITVQLG